MGLQVQAVSPGFYVRFREIGDVFEITEPKAIEQVRANKSNWLKVAPKAKEGADKKDEEKLV